MAKPSTDKQKHDVCVKLCLYSCNYLDCLIFQRSPRYATIAMAANARPADVAGPLGS